jgi:hypothetical protein
MTALALAFGLAVGTWIGAALRGTQLRRVTAQRDDAELNATIRAEAADQLVDDLEHASRTITHIITGEHPTIPGNAA